MLVLNGLRSYFRLVWVALLSSVILFIGCGETTAPPEAAVEQYTLHGTVVRLNHQNMAATIDHEEIVGWMGAMTMDFPIRDKAELDKLQVGDRITGTVLVAPAGYHLAEIQVVERAAQEQKSPEQP